MRRNQRGPELNLKSRLAALTTATAMAAAILATGGCGTAQPLTYAPAAYGQNGQCYYLNSPAEVTALENAGLCPRSWVPAPMPLSWEEEYYDYYDSPVYYDTYVPVRYRTVYVTRVTTFGRTYRSQISTLSKSATYRTSSGGTVKGTGITGKTRFGSGCSFSCAGSKYGSGSLRSGSGSGSRTGTSRTSTSRYGSGSLRGSSGHR